MTVTARDLDSKVKTAVEDIVFKRLMCKYRTLPVIGENKKVKDAMDSYVIQQCVKAVQDYYSVFMERSKIDVDISVDDVVDIYFHRI